MSVWLFHSDRNWHNATDSPYVTIVTVWVYANGIPGEKHLINEVENYYGKQSATDIGIDPVLFASISSRDGGWFLNNRIFRFYEEIVVPREWLKAEVGRIVFSIDSHFVFSDEKEGADTLLNGSGYSNTGFYYKWDGETIRVAVAPLELD